MSTLQDDFRRRVESVIEELNMGDAKPLSMTSSQIAGKRFIPDFVISRGSKPLLIIEEKKTIIPFIKSVFAKGLSEWDSYGILTDNVTFIVFGRFSCTEISRFEDLKPAVEEILEMARQEGSFQVDNDNVQNGICDLIIKSAKNHLTGSRENDVINLAESWGKASDPFFEVENGSYVLKDSAESALFDTLLGRCNVKDCLCRYCSLQSLFRMLKNRKYYLNNVLNMNDKTEGKYFEEQIHGSYEETLFNKIEYFIMSCSSSEKKDDFDMWRLYGEDTKGCCLIFRITNQCDSDFRIYPINYGNESGSHPEVEFLRDILKPQNSYKIVLKHLNEWGLFFKPFEYHNEKEVRVLYHSGQCQESPDEEYFVNERYGIATKCLGLIHREPR